MPVGTPAPHTATCSLALDDADSENGCLRVVPGSQTGELRPGDPVVELPLRRGDMTVHDEMIIDGSGGSSSKDRWRRTYIAAFRPRACVDYESAIGFTHSHNDSVN